MFTASLFRVYYCFDAIALTLDKQTRRWIILRHLFFFLFMRFVSHFLSAARQRYLLVVLINLDQLGMC